MTTLTKPSKFSVACLAASLLLLIGASCAPAAVPTPPDPVIQTVEVTQVVTRVVTVEETRLVDVPITDTPTPTPIETSTPAPTSTRTRIPSPTPTWDPPLVQILQHTACWYGPGTAYLYKYGLNATVWMRVIGRNEDGSWLAIKASSDKDANACWIQTDLVKFLVGDITGVPVLWIGLPYSVLYQPPIRFRATRTGNEVTITWEPVWQTEDDYNGYLIEAWVCQGGKQVFRPTGYKTDVFQNDSAIRAGSWLEVKITDEPGCDVPSRARLYTVEKHGYTNYVMIAWPGFDSSPAATATP
jgi:hypothetical protein